MKNDTSPLRGARRTWLRTALAVAASAGLGAGIPARAADQPARVLRIGYQKYGTLTLLKARGDLEKRLAPQGISVKWTEFPAGPQLLEGLNVGSIDFGTVGEAPPIFAQAAGADLVYVAHQPPAPTAEAIIVPKDSTLKSVAGLKGKRIALNKGSNVHYLLVKALAKAGVSYKDVQPVFLPPADARAAFERGSVDAWVIWDPFLAAAETQLGARVLADGQGLVANHQFYLAARGYADNNAAVIGAIVDELARLDAWSAQHPKEVAAVLAAQIGLSAEVTERAAARFAYGIRPVNASVVAEQQKIADAFHQLKLIPKPIRVADALPPAGTLAAWGGR
ncbi:sulfonate ABC transporter substrate-binding protein [Aquabacterium sp. A7-Y]|uniref:sulfonate ABC transporter substrate-binding protein n=1 Tax=Aquabacterium sp. A7-Y TaxID=1349605 RepID=UPI00223D4A97|nr:sulfonate ABC transporter substrate-binding protein [Aquabacterium sp. A7-Y]MCW7537140.1 sulfonate ABC transporter substrate-binding protein [Aquabacterium sp. A7-Y]